MITSRSRSRSATRNGVATPKSAKSNDQSPHDKFNLYGPEKISAVQNDFIEIGRAKAREYLKNPNRLDGVAHSVELDGMVTEGNLLVDKFRVVGQNGTGCTATELIKFQAYGGRVVESGGNVRTVFVYVPHKRYLPGVFGFELDARDWMWALAVTVVTAVLAYGTYASDAFMQASQHAKFKAD